MMCKSHILQVRAMGTMEPVELLRPDVVRFFTLGCCIEYKFQVCAINRGEFARLFPLIIAAREGGDRAENSVPFGRVSWSAAALPGKYSAAAINPRPQMKVPPVGFQEGHLERRQKASRTAQASLSVRCRGSPRSSMPLKALEQVATAAACKAGEL